MASTPSLHPEGPAMTRRVQLPHMVRRGRIWSAVVRVPADVCAALGRSVCKETTGEEGPGKGLGQGQPWIKAWKPRIEAAHKGEALTQQQKIDAARQVPRQSGFRT